MLKCWDAVKHLKTPENGFDEKRHVRTYFEELLKIIIENSDVRRRLRVHDDVYIALPVRHFDLAISASHIERMTYVNAECMITLQAPAKKNNKRKVEDFFYDSSRRFY